MIRFNSVIRKRIVVVLPTPAGLNVSFRDVSGIEEGFKIYMTPEGGSRSLKATLAPSTATQPGYDTGKGAIITALLENLTPNTLYTGEIVSFRAVQGESASLTFEAYTSPQYAPSSLVVSSITSTGMHLAWTKATEDPKTGYLIEKQVGSSTTWVPHAAVGASVASYDAVELSSNTAYRWRVISYNDNGSYLSHGKSLPGNSAVGTTLNANPTIVSAQIIEKRTVRVTFSELINIGTNIDTPVIVATVADLPPVVLVPSTPYDDDFVDFTPSRDLYKEEVFTLGYTQLGNGLQDNEGALLATVSGVPVSNSSDLSSRVYGPENFEGAEQSKVTSSLPIHGLKSLAIIPNNDTQDFPIPEMASHYCLFRHRFSLPNHTGTSGFISFMNSALVTLWRAEWRAGEKVRLVNESNGPDSVGVGVAGTPYYVWIDCEIGGTTTLRMSPNPVRPTTDGVDGAIVMSRPMKTGFGMPAFLRFSRGTNGGAHYFDDYVGLSIPSSAFPDIFEKAGT